jgi:hypothetical protein
MARAARYREAICRGEIHSCQHTGGGDYCPCFEREQWEAAVDFVYLMERAAEAADARAP